MDTNLFNKLTEERTVPEAVLVSVFPKNGDDAAIHAAEASLAELERLLENVRQDRTK